METITLPSAQATLDRLEGHLVAAGAEGELAFGLLSRLLTEPAIWGDDVIMLLGMEGDEPSALVMRTGRHPALIVGFRDEAEIDYAQFVRAMRSRQMSPTSVNGAARCSIPFAAAWHGETGVETRTLRDLRAFELHALRPPRAPGGAARAVAAADTDLLLRWCTAFVQDIGEELTSIEAQATVARFESRQDMLVWVVDDEPVAMAAINRRTPFSSCVAWVYTPPEHRRHGYASAVVAALSQRELDAGAQWCSLFTDLANPTSNHIYAELGYEPRCDYRHIELRWIDEGGAP
ncbi:MAG: putative acyltransferase [Thermoleophilia bacterium]|nr:putative acyltransferase [Thermoleophilia bacterium]